MRTEEPEPPLFMFGYFICSHGIIISFGIGTSQHTNVIKMEDCDFHAWEKSIRTHLKRQDSSTLTIPLVPERLRKGENDAYEPRIISFGPYHHGKAKLQAMEKYKLSFQEVILSFKPQITRKRYINAIKEEAAKIKTYYTVDFDTASEKFAEMMLIDGCFLVGYFLRFYYRVSDELDSMVWMHDLIRNDILLLENQLPFFILIKIFEPLQFTPSLMDLAINYLNLVDRQKKVNFRPPEPVHHLLHLYHSYCLYTPPASTDPKHQTPSVTALPEEQPLLISIPREESDSPCATVHHEAEKHRLHSATALHEAGVKFEKKEVKGSSSLDVTFNNGKMMIPPLVIDSFNKSRLRNLVAFEQFYPNFSKEFKEKSFTAYVQFMDFIVNTPADVALLHKEGIIRHFVGSDENAANFFNELNKGVFVQSNHYLAPLYTEVCEYAQKSWHKWLANLMHNYCNSPWAILGIVVGGILLLLSILQTISSA